MYRLIHLLLRPLRSPRMLPLVLRVIVHYTRIKTLTATWLHWRILRRWGLGVFRVDRAGKVYLKRDNGQIVRVTKK